MNKESASSISIENCIHNLTYEGIWKPLPERETEIVFINDFIDKSFTSKKPSFLIASGPKLCGKTSVLRTCSLMSEFETQIYYFDCTKNDIYEFQIPSDLIRRLVIFDNFQIIENIELISFFHDQNFSVIIVMQQYEEIDNLPDFATITRINFSRYNRHQIFNILIECMKGCPVVVDKNIINKISIDVEKNDGTIQDAIQALLNYLQAISGS